MAASLPQKIADPNTPEVKTVSVNVTNNLYYCSSVVYEARCNTPGVKTVNELAEEKWTPIDIIINIVKKKGWNTCTRVYERIGHSILIHLAQ